MTVIEEPLPRAGEVTLGGAVPSAGRRGRLYVWEIPVRVTHWVNVASIVVLSITGAYIADPFLVPPGGPVMATMRFLHVLVGFLFIASGTLRVYWMFAGNRFAHWRAFLPVTRQQLRELPYQLGWYLFLRRDPARVLGHNMLASASYLVVFGLFLLQVITGLALIGVHGTEPWATLFGWLPALLGLQTVRLVHHLIMWAIIGFVFHHVYAAVLVDHWEKTGLLTSMFTGQKFVTPEEAAEARDGGPEQVARLRE